VPTAREAVAKAPPGRPLKTIGVPSIAQPAATSSQQYDYFSERSQGLLNAAARYDVASGPETHVAVIIIVPPSSSKRKGARKAAFNITDERQRPIVCYAGPGGTAGFMRTVGGACSSISGLPRAPETDPFGAAALNLLAPSIILHDLEEVSNLFDVKNPRAPTVPDMARARAAAPAGAVFLKISAEERVVILAREIAEQRERIQELTRRLNSQ
jgi:hypothetical protein